MSDEQKTEVTEAPDESTSSTKPEEPSLSNELEELMYSYLSGRSDLSGRSETDDDPQTKWKNDLNRWKEYSTDILSETTPSETTQLPFEDKDKRSWVKSYKDDTNYLCAWLNNNGTLGGINTRPKHAMIYHTWTWKDPTTKELKEKYYSAYQDQESKFLDRDKHKAAEKDYKDKIFPLLRDVIAAARDHEYSNKLSALEKEDRFKIFSGKQMLYKIAVLESYSEQTYDSYNKFLPVYEVAKIDRIAEALGISLTESDTFLKKNEAVYTELKKSYATVKNALKKASDKQIDASSDKPIDESKMDLAEIVELYQFSCDVYYGKNNELFENFGSPNVIFSGAPGTGKTYTVSKDIKRLHDVVNKKLYNLPKMIQFHPSYTYQDFIEGIKPIGIDNNGNIKLSVMNGSFKDFCIKVCRENEKTWKTLVKNNKPSKDNPSTLEKWPHYYFVVDEINRGNLSNIFGETFTLLEYRDYDFSGNYSDSSSNDDINSAATLVETTYSNIIKEMIKANDETADALVYKKVMHSDIDFDIKFGIPFNIHFIGMMNDVDRSIDSFDLAFRRRFRWQPMYCDYNAVYTDLFNKYCKDDNGYSDTILKYVKSCIRLNLLITGERPDSKELYPSDIADINKIKTKKSPWNYGKIYEIGQGYFLKIKQIVKKLDDRTTEITANHKERLFEDYISGTIKEYVRQMVDSEKDINQKLKDAKAEFTSEND